MAATFKRAFRQDLTKPLRIYYNLDLVFSKDNLANEIQIELFDGDTAFSGGGSVSGTVIRADGGTIPINGTISGNAVTVALTEACMEIPGTLQVYVKLTSGDVKTTIFAGVFTAIRTETGTVIDPGTIIPSITELINQIDAAIDSIPADYSTLLGSVASTYSASKTYAVGDYVWYDGALYRCTTAISTAESWTAAHWSRAVLGDDVTGLKSALKTVEKTAIQAVALENGSFNASTGAKSNTDGRMRTTSFIPDYIQILVPGNTVSGVTNGILLYAWDSVDTYIGFWGGSGWATSGSEYLDSVDMDSFRENYPGYKFKAVMQVQSASVPRILNGYMKNSASEVDELSIKVSYVDDETVSLETEMGGFDSNTGEETTRYDRLRLVNFIDENVVELTGTNYSASYPGILLYAWDFSGNYIGFWGGSGWVTSGAVYLRTIDMDQFRHNYPNYKFRGAIVLRSSVVQTINGKYEGRTIKRINAELNKLSVADLELTYGSFNGTTGNETSSSDRNRTVDFIPNCVTKLEHGADDEVAQYQDTKILLYAWDEAERYIGFWGGSGWVTSGSVYLDTVDMTEFRTNYPSYKFKAVLQANNTIRRIIATQTNASAELSARVSNLEKNQKQFPVTVQNNNLCLAGIRKNIPTNRFATCTGFLFHQMINGNNKLYYGANLENVREIGEVNFNVTQMRFAISPKDGRIIATQRDVRNGIYVWDGVTVTHLDSFQENPCGWLYNSGVDFISDGNDEYCIFAEYWGNNLITPLHVWRGKWPYTSIDDWEIVLTQDAYNAGETGDGITHFHMIRRDPWTDILYCTSGDDSEKCKWWYSTDRGENWVLLTTGSTSGWENHQCRCINFIFTPDYIYWATDKGTNHAFNRIARGQNGVIDISTREKLATLPDYHATNFICYSEYPHGIFMYDRIDIGYTAQYGSPVIMNFWNLDTNELETAFTIPLRQNTWGGSRGGCYVDYTSGYQPHPAMGFSIDTPCIFDVIAPDRDAVGTIIYDIGAKTIKFATM